MPYIDRTDSEKINEEIEKNLVDEENAKSVVSAIATACAETEPKQDFMTQWLTILNDEIRVRAAKWQTSKDVIEIYPSGTSGKGKDDRLWFQVGSSEVAVIKAYKSKHLE